MHRRRDHAVTLYDLEFGTRFAPIRSREFLRNSLLLKSTEMQKSRSQPSNDERYSSHRARMVEEQLLGGGIHDDRVLAAMKQVPREEFVPRPSRVAAYEDGPLPIGLGQTISQPFTVAFMCESLQLTGNERVLEVGTGSGYAAAVLSYLAAEIYTVERIPELATEATQRLARLGFDNVHVKLGDGTLGLPAKAPFDAIVVTAGGGNLPPPLITQLVDGGRIVIPIGNSPAAQTMFRFTRHGTELRSEKLGQFIFVPLLGRYGWHTSQTYPASEAAS